MEMNPQGQDYIVHEMPEEEVVESAAARVRPILLSADPVHWSKVLNAIGYLWREWTDEKAKTTVVVLRHRWNNRVASHSGKARAYVVQMKRGDQDATTIADSDLGMAWFYGDVVHADTKRREQGSDYGIGERYRAAVLMIMNAMVCNRMTLNFILRLQKNALTSLPDNIFKEEVVVADPIFRKEAEFFVGEVGTPMPTDITGPIPEGFEAFDPSKHIRRQS